MDAGSFQRVGGASDRRVFRGAVRPVRLGILARADKGGLGYQSLAVYTYLQPAVTVVVDIGNRRRPPTAEGWYPGADRKSVV